MTSEYTHALNEIHTAIVLTKCQQCGCMRETLDQIDLALSQLPAAEVEIFRSSLPHWLKEMKAIQYTCLGCEHCYAGSAQNAFSAAFPQAAGFFGLSCEIQVNASVWPPVAGEYQVVNPDAPVAVATLASLDLPKQLAEHRPEGLAIAGKLETENIGIDKLIKNIIANPHIRYLIVVGVESAGHQSGQALLALAENGIDLTGRIGGAHGKRPILRNISAEEIETFRHQVQVVERIGCESVEEISALIQELAQQTETPIAVTPCGCSGST